MRNSSVLAALAAGTLEAAGGCTLTADDFEPAAFVVHDERADAGRAPPLVTRPRAPATDAAPPAECVGLSEIAGCVTLIAPPAPDPEDAGSAPTSGWNDACTTSTPATTTETCADGVLNGTELGVDCGGKTCPGCPVGEPCNGGGDCSTLVCGGDRCAPARCDDQTLNQNESDVDCGGSCQACAPGLRCIVDGECQSGVCEQGRCCGGVLGDCTRCARRLIQALSCEFSSDPVAVSDCNGFLDCLANNPTVCPVRHAAGCSVEGGVCDHTTFGGNAGPGVALADSILGTAQCFF